MRYQPRTTRRAAFTLIELIVVMAIIIVIASLTIGAVSKSFNWVKQKNTEQTMTKIIERVVGRRIEDIYKEARDWDTNQALYDQAAGDGRRAEVLKVLHLYKWSFPQTYSEARRNFEESLLLYDTQNGYPLARAIYLSLRSKVPAAMTDDQFCATPAAADMAKILPRQSAVCLATALRLIRGSSLDEFTNEEVVSLPAFDALIPFPPDAIDIPPQAAFPNGFCSSNSMFVDAWGTPLFFLRHGNYWDNLGTVRTAINRAPFFLGLVNPPVAPVSSVLGDEYYDILVNSVDPASPYLYRGRAYLAFRSRWNTDPFDPEGLLRNSEAWRTPAGITTAGWVPGWVVGWLSPTGGTQGQDYFRSTFGYRPQPSNIVNGGPVARPDRWAQEYAPFVIISAGGDKLFTTWDDNLDSYRLKINTSGQQ